MKTANTPFVYTLTFIDPHSGNRRWYIGVKYGQNSSPSDLWQSYFSSSKVIHQLLSEYGTKSFRTKIIKTFADEISARAYEERFIRKAITFGLRLNVQLINKGIPNRNFANSMKGRRFEEIFDKDTCEKLITLLKRPKTKEAVVKMINTRRKNNSYHCGGKHAMAKKYVVISPTGEQHNLHGNLKTFCAEKNLSWQTLYSHIDGGPVILDRKRYRNISRLSDRFWNSIGWQITLVKQS